MTSGNHRDLRPGDIPLSEASGSCLPVSASTGETNLVTLSQAGGERESLADILFFQVWKVGQQLIDCAGGREGFHDHSDGHAHAPDTRLAAHYLGVHRDALKLLHVIMIALAAMSDEDTKRRDLVELLGPYRTDALANHPWKEWAGMGSRIPGAQSRWSQCKDLSWEPLRAELVAEVAYEHMQGIRFRHMAHFRRWRDDKRPRDCTYAQFEVVPPEELGAIFAAGR